jgi:hypothetical protein
MGVVFGHTKNWSNHTKKKLMIGHTSNFQKKNLSLKLFRFRRIGMKRAINKLNMYYGVIDHGKFESDDGLELIRSPTRLILCYN